MKTKTTSGRQLDLVQTVNEARRTGARGGKLAEKVAEALRSQAAQGTGTTKAKPEPLTKKQKRYVEDTIKKIMGVPKWTRDQLLDGPWQPWLKTRLQTLLADLDYVPNRWKTVIVAASSLNFTKSSPVVQFRIR